MGEGDKVHDVLGLGLKVGEADSEMEGELDTVRVWVRLGLEMVAPQHRLGLQMELSN